MDWGTRINNEQGVFMKFDKAVLMHYASGEIVVENNICGAIFNVETEQLERYKLKFRSEESLISYLNENFYFVGFL